MKTKIVCGALAIAALAAQPARAAEPALKLLFTAPFVMPMAPATPGQATAQQQAAKVSIPLPVALGPGLSADEICAEKVGVRFLGVVEAALSERFTVEPRIAGSPTAMPAVTIGIIDPVSLRPGEYQLLIRSSKCKAGAPAEPLDSLVVPLTRSGVKLDALGKVTVDQCGLLPVLLTPTYARRAFSNSIGLT